MKHRNPSNRPFWHFLIASALLLLARNVTDAAESWFARWEGRTYLNLQAGAAFIHETKFKDLTGTIPDKQSAEFDPGFRFDAGIGYKLTDRISLELESGVIRNTIDRVGSASPPLTLYQIPVMFNAKYDYKTGSKFIPYLGLGVGPVVSKLDLDVDLRTESEVAVVFGAQALLGVRYQFDERMSVGLGYKFLAATEAEFRGSLQTRADRFLTHSIGLQLDWRY